MKKPIVLEYGMKIVMKAYPVMYIIPSVKIGAIRAEKQEEAEFIVQKYWKTDTSPNTYKVKLIPIESDLFETETLYALDLKELIASGVALIID